MLGLAWSCDWQGCDASVTVPYGDGGWDAAWGMTGRDSGWIDGAWSLKNTGWIVDSEHKVWCPVHALVKQAQSATLLELRPPEGAAWRVIVEVQKLASRYPGEVPLRIVVGDRGLTLGGHVAPDPELVAALLEHGLLVVGST